MLSELIIPVYLNQRIVFDMIAMLQGGIATVTRISSAELASGKAETDYGAGFGLNAALSSLLKIDVSGKKAGSKEDSSETTSREDRVHTPASILQRLIAILKEQKGIQVVNEQYSPQPSDIVEFAATLRRNPLIETMDIFVDALELADVFLQPQGNKQQQERERKAAKKLKEQMEKFTEKLKAGATVDIIGEKLNSEYRALITLELKFLNDQTMSDLVDGQFTVLGKVIRVISKADNSISLLRKTVLGAMSKKLLADPFSHLKAVEDIQIPDLQLEVHGPVFQIIPIAIYA